MKRKVQYTPEEREELKKQVAELREKEGLTVLKACAKLGLKWTTYYNWVSGKQKTGRKVGKKRRKTKAVLVTSLVPVETETSVFGSSASKEQFKDAFQGANPKQVMDMYGSFVASAFKSLMQSN